MWWFGSYCYFIDFLLFLRFLLVELKHTFYQQHFLAQI